MDADEGDASGGPASTGYRWEVRVPDEWRWQAAVLPPELQDAARDGEVRDRALELGVARGGAGPSKELEGALESAAVPVRRRTTAGHMAEAVRAVAPWAESLWALSRRRSAPRPGQVLQAFSGAEGARGSDGGRGGAAGGEVPALLSDDAEVAHLFERRPVVAIGRCPALKGPAPAVVAAYSSAERHDAGAARSLARSKDARTAALTRTDREDKVPLVVAHLSALLRCGLLGEDPTTAPVEDEAEAPSISLPSGWTRCAFVPDVVEAQAVAAQANDRAIRGDG